MFYIIIIFYIIYIVGRYMVHIYNMIQMTERHHYVRVRNKNQAAYFRIVIESI